MAKITIPFDPVRDPARRAAYRAAGFWNDETLGDWLARHAAARGNHVALRLGNTAWTYAQVAEQTARLANALTALGIAKGDVVAVQLPNTPQFIFSYFAIASIGAVMQTVHMPYRAPDIEVLLAHSGAVAAICLDQAKDYAAAETLLALRAKLPQLRAVIVSGDQVPAGAHSLPAIAAAASATLPRIALTGEDAFLLLYTSGTTSSPKGVPHAYQDFLANARLSAAALDVTPNDLLLSAAPFTHLYGLFAINMALAVGASVALLPVFSPPALADAIRVMRPTIGFTAPAHIAACMNAGWFKDLDLACFRYVQISGSAVPPALARSFEPLLKGGKVMQLWGMTELQAGAYTRLTDSETVRMESTGATSPGTELRVVDSAGAPVATETEGELQMRGPSLFAGYLNNDAATRAAFAPDGWFKTGDLAARDAAGNVRLTGRVKDIINRGGIKFNPLDIEALLLQHPAIAEVAVAPVPDAVLGEKACAFVVLKPGAALDLDGAREFLAARKVAKLTWPEQIEIVNVMPVTPTRKIIKGQLVAALLARTQSSRQQLPGFDGDQIETDRIESEQ